eukprot:CAMPEP_0196741338 /NCGR_PEP_ID=MMETSP1091-20130531/39295_1 /TAXON_ID=302021 /ORGANISM="Rhodomonas sp., Strain CCMP768" /LENGTH=112 /DNA_ID=CAMNT_0042086983 /DNA_START=9 /DNA_END=347 /DNA_ORIENTATION=-
MLCEPNRVSYALSFRFDPSTTDSTVSSPSLRNSPTGLPKAPAAFEETSQATLAAFAAVRTVSPAKSSLFTATLDAPAPITAPNGPIAIHPNRAPIPAAGFLRPCAVAFAFAL